MQLTELEFDELNFFAQVKKKPGLFLGKPSILSLRDQLFGMDYAFLTLLRRICRKSTD